MKEIKDIVNQIHTANCLDFMRDVPDNCIDLVVTSPPYDNLRDYNGYNFDFKFIAKELFRVTKQGGVVVWIVGDSIIDGSETGTSFIQALYFKEMGFNLHDTMIYKKNGIAFPCPTRYLQCFEYMFIFVKGNIRKVNLLADRKNNRGNEYKNHRQERQKNGKVKIRNKDSYIIKPNGTRWNIWEYEIGYMKSTLDKESYKHPAIFPDKLAEDHILSWSNEGDIVMDIFSGSGTTCKMARKNDRKYIGIDVSEEYNQIARERIRVLDMQPKLF